jgi:hypothetical protein
MARKKVKKRTKEVLGKVDDFNVGSFGKGSSMKDSSIFSDPEIGKAVDIDNKRRKEFGL